MEEKWEELLSQYDLNVKRMSWARGAKLLETDKGNFLMKQFTGKLRQLAMEDAVTSGLVVQGYHYADSIYRTKEGTLFAVGAVRRYGRGHGSANFAERENQSSAVGTQSEETDVPEQLWWQQPLPENRDIYVIRSLPSGEEGSFKNPEFLKRAALALAELHNALEKVCVSEGLAGFHPSMALMENWRRHNRELRRIRRYILEKKQKNEFEILFLSMEEGFLRAAQDACTLLEQGQCRQLFDEAVQKRILCHGNFNYHNLLELRTGLAIVGFENTGIGLPVFDLYQMMRKILEKNRWDKTLAIEVLNEYNRRRRLSMQERELLYIMLLYPEKFWKVSNHYYNGKKSWINRIDITKLQELGKQQQRREETLEYLRNI